MSVAAELHPSTKLVHDDRKIIGPGGNRTARTPNPCQKPKHNQNPHQQPLRSSVKKLPNSLIRKKGSVHSSCSSGSSSSTSSTAKTTPTAERREKPVVKKAVKSPRPVRSTKRAGRCDWITTHSDPIYMSFHDEEWGVPVHNDYKLFELLCLSIALAEHTWISILFYRDNFRKLFDGFNPAVVAELSEEKLVSIATSSRQLLSESKVRAMVDNANHVVQVQKEFGSFSNYCWSFVNNKPLKHDFRYQRHVPVKIPKAELFSKDLMRRGFRCVGSTVIYSFMQVSGMVNDHLTTCFRHEACNLSHKNKDL